MESTGKIQIIRLSKTDLLLFKKLVTLFNEVFEENSTIASDAHLQKLIAKPEFYAVVAITNDILLGGLTAYELQSYYNDKSELYIYDIAIKSEFQNKGIGKQLIQHLKELGSENSISTIFVDAHSEDKQAVAFYGSVFGEREKVDHFNFEIQSSS
ncbi:GNAT family N-acetyltransferase [Flagellimonas sp. HMM57]|uniref:GNAT family N-acetyltransferase n=1 Tax=unclassified Flagellimonas TaxID=2644544 RepID=UPI0013D8913F|nr:MULTISPECIES: GNAT family N-acetyltransferase [unclassified Flagellimonas]UII77454.1 GNAT family N-acetyltransferase [Flagellimonas sp. HMM57]